MFTCMCEDVRIYMYVCDTRVCSAYMHGLVAMHKPISVYLCMYVQYAEYIIYLYN